MSQPKDRIEIHVLTDERNKKIGFVARVTGFCGQCHEAKAKKALHAKNNVRNMVRACPICSARLAAQSQSAEA